ncbi:MAG: nucleotide 5'-monophosphate nucleosidase PpnN [Pseudomonadota bacterium]
MNHLKVNAEISPKRSLEVLSQKEVKRLKVASDNALYSLFRQCALAIFHSGSESDNSPALLSSFQDFDIDIIQQNRGLRLNIINAPSNAFVDGEIIESSRDMVFSALRDIIYSESEKYNKRVDLNSSAGLTDHVFHLLRNANALHTREKPRLVVCWGGHSIGELEYDYTKDVGHQLGLRKLDICTGCGPGAMKGPMKGATIAHAKQRIKDGRYLGLTEPGIITAESPNPIVNELVILPDIEKRLEAFIRLGHGIVVFPGGAGTTEEILYLLGILLHPNNKNIPFPVVFTGPDSAHEYFEKLDAFIGNILGRKAQQCYQIIIGDSAKVATTMVRGLAEVEAYRRDNNDAYFFNWSLFIDEEFQKPFIPTHKNVAALELDPDLPIHQLAANLRRVFSAIVAGNVKSEGIQFVQQHGPYQINGNRKIMAAVEELLDAFVQQQRMNLPGNHYVPCYEIA